MFTMHSSPLEKSPMYRYQRTTSQTQQILTVASPMLSTKIRRTRKKPSTTWISQNSSGESSKCRPPKFRRAQTRAWAARKLSGNRKDGWQSMLLARRTGWQRTKARHRLRCVGMTPCKVWRGLMLRDHDQSEDEEVWTKATEASFELHSDGVHMVLPRYKRGTAFL